MDYARIYAEFINDRKSKQPQKPDYFEKHHIVPRSLGGGNESENLIRLTIEDHIHAHILLARIHGGKLWGAILFMTKTSIGRSRSFSKIPSKSAIRSAVFARKMFSIHCRGESASQYGRKHTDESKKMMSVAHKRRGENGEIWTQNNRDLISGNNHWTKNPENADALEKAKPIFRANIAKASLANIGAGNSMHRPEVAKKVSDAIKKHWFSGTGPASECAKIKRLASHNTEDYINGARERVLGENNPMHGMSGGLNPNSRRVLCVETNQIFESVKDAIAFCGGDVTKAARTGKKAGGYTWVRLSPHSSDNRVMKHEGKQQA